MKCPVSRFIMRAAYAGLLVCIFLLSQRQMRADLLVGSSTCDCVLRYSDTGTFLGQFVSTGSGGLLFPLAPFFGPDGNLYVLDYSGNSILRYDGKTGAFIDSFVSSASGLLHAPSAAVFGPDGNLYVGEWTSHAVKKFNGATGAPMGVFTSGGSIAIPVTLVFGPDGNLYVGDEINLLKYNGTTGAFMGVFIPGAGAHIMLFGPDGDIYVANAFAGVFRYNATTGALISQFVPGNGIRADGGLAFGPDGNLYVGYDYETGSADFVSRFNGQTGSLIDVFIPSGTIGLVTGIVFMPKSAVPLHIQPDHGGNAGSVTVQIIGSGFDVGARVSLTGLGPDIVGTNASAPYPSAISTTFNLTGSAPGIRSIVITNPNGTTATLAGTFTVEEGGSPDVSISIIGRDKIRFGTPQTYYGLIQNHGAVDALNVAGFINQPDPQTSTFFGTVGAFSSISFPISVTGPLSGCTVVNSGEHMVNSGDSCAAFEAEKAAAEAYLNSLYGLRLVNLLLLENSIQFGICFNPSNPSSGTSCDWLEAIDSSFDSAIKSAESDENLLCAKAAAAGCPLNCNDPADISALKTIGDGLRRTIDQLKQIFTLVTIPQDQLNALKSQVALFETQALALPTSLAFPPQPQPQPPTAIPTDNSSSLQICTVGSLDPNSKSGPNGIGSSKFIQGSLAMPYLISTQNTLTATAPAQSVTITDTLDANLDANTLTLGPITFPNKVVSPPSIPLSGFPFSATVDLRPTTNLLVQVTASVDTSTATLTEAFHSLDPITGKPPTDPTAGFLPPGAEGSVFFTVMPKSGLATGTTIQNTATVVFDTNAPINTPIWTNALDNTPPTSHVISLPATEATLGFPVLWAGTDVGSGIRSYAIYVSDNGATYSPWLANTAATSATYAGQTGHTYGFYSIATDNVGNVEAQKTAAEATTEVNRVFAIVALSSNANPILAQNAVTLTATVTSTSGTPTGTVAFLDGTTPLGTATLTGGTAVYTTSSLTVGSHSITVSYGGDSNFLAASSSPALTELVQDFTFNISASSSTVLPGGSAVFSFTATPTGGSTFPSTVTLAAIGLPAGANSSFSPQSLTAGSGTSTVTLKVVIPQIQAGNERVKLPRDRELASNRSRGSASRARRLAPVSLALILLPFAGKLRRTGKRLSRMKSFLLILASGFALSLGMNGCGTGSGYFAQGQKIYTVTITGTSGALSHSATVNLTVE